MARQSPFMSSTQHTYPTSYQQRDTRYTTNSSVESAMGLNRRPSLLAGYHNHFSSPGRTSLASYYPTLAPMSMGPHVDEPSKRSRFTTGGNLSYNSQLLPLSIDIKKEQQVYQPQTEAISPTPDDPKIDSNMRDSTIIRNAISKLEGEIDLTMKKLHRAKLSQSEIKSQADRSAADEDENDDRDELLKGNGSQTLIEKILHENRKKAEDSHKVFNNFNNNMDLTIPLYQEPSDLESIQRIRTQYVKIMKNRLKDFFKKKHNDYDKCMKTESQKYDKIYREWQKSIEKDEKNVANKDLTTYRETFEKTFPELRKTREDKEKKQSITNDSSTSEQQVSLNTLEQELEIEEEKMRKSSIVPPILYDRWQRKHQYFNQNSLITYDADEFYKERTEMPYWSTEEKQIFVEKFTQSPKNFGYISSFLENKTTEQCVQFYYKTKKTENYKNLLRKQTQTNRRKAKQNPTTTTTTVTSSTTIETTVVTKVTSSNTIVSSTSQQIVGQTSNAEGGQDADRAVARLENDEERREINAGEGVEEKRANKNRCQLLSCTTEKLGKKKNRKNRLRAFPTKWDELTKENREIIRRSLQIPLNVRRCCTRCYEKLIIQIRQQKATTQPITEEYDDDDDESSKNPSNKIDEQVSKPDNEWTEHEIDAFIEARHKFNDNWAQIAELVHRSEQSCRAFYQKHRKKNDLIDNENNIDEDNASISGSEDVSRRLTIPVKPSGNQRIDEENDDEQQKIIMNDDSNDSPCGMVIDDNDEQASVVEVKNDKMQPGSTLVTINSLVEKEIMKTLIETDKRTSNNNNNNSNSNTNINTTNKTISEKNQPPPTTNPVQPPPLVTVTKPQSPPIPPPSSHNQQQLVNKGSIMRGTPLSSSSSSSNKPISIDTSTTHSHVHPHHFSSPRNEYSHHSSPYIDLPHIKSSKMVDPQQQLYLQQQQQAAYLRHYSQQHGAHSNYPPPSTPTQYLQQHKSSAINNQQQIPTNTNKSIGIDTSNTDTYETLRADFVTSKFLNTTHSPNRERQTRHPSEQRSPSQTSTNPQLLASPASIGPPTTNPSISSSTHSQQAAFLAASQLLASTGMYPQDLIATGLLPYSHYYGSTPGAPFYIDPRLMHDFTAAANSEQLKSLRANRHVPLATTHSPPDPSTYSNQSSKRHSLENTEHMRYPLTDYVTPLWRSQNLNNAQQIHSQMKSTSGSNENPLLKLGELPRQSTRISSSNDRDTRSPDDYQHRVNQSRTPVESPSAHFQRVEALNHHKTSSHDKLNPNFHYTDHSSDGNQSSYIRQTANIHKPQSSHHSQQQHHQTSSSSNRSPLVLPTQLSPHNTSSYMFHNLHHSPVGAISPHQQSAHHPHQSHHSQSRSSHHPESLRNNKEPISIQEFMKQNVNEFVASTNNDNSKILNSDLSLSSENSNNQTSRGFQSTSTKTIDNPDQPILLDDDEDSNSTREQNETTTDGNSKTRPNQNLNKSTTDSEMSEKRRDSSIKKILSNLPLEKQEYIEINQKIQNSTISASKVHSNNDLNGLERTNSSGGREPTRSRGSITMRMLMGANGIYADGKAQPMTANELNEQSSKRTISPPDKSQSLEYLIRGELVRSCPTLPKSDEPLTIFQNRHISNRSSPSTQHRQTSSQHVSKRMKTSPKDETSSNSEQRHSTNEKSTDLRDPFVLQTHAKNSHHPSSQSSSSSSSNIDCNWQTYAQQQYQHSLASRSSRQSTTTSGSITQGSPVLSATRVITDQQQYPSTANNQLVNPSYSYYMTKNEQQLTPPFDHSPKGKFARRGQQNLSSPSDVPQESTLLITANEQSSSPINPIQITPNNRSSPIAVSPISSSTSPTTSVSSNSTHPFKKRLISGYEFEQQRNSPSTISPVISTSTKPETNEESTTVSNPTIQEENTEEISNVETVTETNTNSTEEPESST